MSWDKIGPVESFQESAAELIRDWFDVRDIPPLPMEQMLGAFVWPTLSELDEAVGISVLLVASPSLSWVFDPRFSAAAGSRPMITAAADTAEGWFGLLAIAAATQETNANDCFAVGALFEHLAPEA